jgi:hypothetical protein
MLARRSGRFALQAASRRFLAGAAMAAVAIFAAPCVQAQQPPAQPEARVIVIGEGSVHIAPDYAQIRGGVTTKGKTVKEATDANSKVMAAITAALLNAGVAQTDIKTAQFSIQPAYAPPQPQAEPKLVGYSVSNQVTVTVRALGKVSDTLDRMVDAGAPTSATYRFCMPIPPRRSTRPAKPPSPMRGARPSFTRTPRASRSAASLGSPRTPGRCRPFPRRCSALRRAWRRRCRSQPAKIRCGCRSRSASTSPINRRGVYTLTFSSSTTRPTAGRLSMRSLCAV